MESEGAGLGLGLPQSFARPFHGPKYNEQAHLKNGFGHFIQIVGVGGHFMKRFVASKELCGRVFVSWPVRGPAVNLW